MCVHVCMHVCECVFVHIGGGEYVCMCVCESKYFGVLRPVNHYGYIREIESRWGESMQVYVCL